MDDDNQFVKDFFMADKPFYSDNPRRRQEVLDSIMRITKLKKNIDYSQQLNDTDKRP